MAFKIKDGVRVGTVDVFNNSGALLVNAPTATKFATARNINGVSFDGTGDITISAAAAQALTIGGGLSGTSYDGSTAVTIAIDSTVVTLTGTQTLTNKTLTSPAMTTPTLGVASATSINKVTITAPSTGSTLTIADGKVLTASNTLTFTGTDSSSVAFGAGGTVAYQGGTLAQFASTTSAQLRGVLSDETGTGALVFADTPTIATPVFTTSAQTPLLLGSTSGSGQLTLRGTSNASKSTAGIVMDESIASSSNTTGTLVVTGGVGIGGALNIGGNVHTDGNIVIEGNLTVNGTTVTVSSTNLEITDPIIYLAQGNSANANDIGFVGHFDNGTYQHTGLVRDASDGIWKLFSGVAGEPSGTIDFSSYVSDALEALQFRSTVTTGTAPLVVASTTEVANLRSATSTKLHTARDINGVSFDGTGNITITATATNALTIGTGLSGTSYDGSGAVTIAIDSSVATLTGSQTLTNKSLGDFNQKTGSTTVAGNAVIQATVATTSSTAVDSFAATTYRGAKYLVQVTQGSNYQVSEILVIHNGTTTNMTEYGVVETNGSLSTFTTDISGGNVRLLVVMGSATSATINITRTALVV